VRQVNRGIPSFEIGETPHVCNWIGAARAINRPAEGSVDVDE
jgi:hypothetical protein